MFNCLILISTIGFFAVGNSLDCSEKVFETPRKQCADEGVKDQTDDMTNCIALKVGFVTANGELNIEALETYLKPLIVNQESYESYITETKRCANLAQGKDRSVAQAMDDFSDCPFEDDTFYETAFTQAFCK